MITKQTKTAIGNSADEAEIRAIHQQMTDAWNVGDAEAFASGFTEDADFIAFEGTHLKGRLEIVSFHHKLFEGPVKGTRIQGEVKFVRFLSSKLAVMHGAIQVTLPGESEPSPGRNSMQLFVAVKRGKDWFVEAMQNSRTLTVELQYFLDDFDSLTPEAQMEVTSLAGSLKQEAPISK